MFLHTVNYSFLTGVQEKQEGVTLLSFFDRGTGETGGGDSTVATVLLYNVPAQKRLTVVRVCWDKLTAVRWGL